MRATIIMVLMLMAIGMVYAESSVNFLTVGQGDLRYCLYGGECYFTVLNVTNETVTNQNINGTIYINGTDIYDIFVDESGDTMTGDLTMSTANIKLDAQYDIRFGGTGAYIEAPTANNLRLHGANSVFIENDANSAFEVTASNTDTHFMVNTASSYIWMGDEDVVFNRENNAIYNYPLIIDDTGNEVFLIRKNGDSRDLLTYNSNAEELINNGGTTVQGGWQFDNDTDNDLNFKKADETIVCSLDNVDERIECLEGYFSTDITALGDVIIDADTSGLYLGDAQEFSMYASGNSLYLTRTSGGAVLYLTGLLQVGSGASYHAGYELNELDGYFQGNILSEKGINLGDENVRDQANDGLITMMDSHPSIWQEVVRPQGDYNFYMFNLWSNDTTNENRQQAGSIGVLGTVGSDATYIYLCASGNITDECSYNNKATLKIDHDEKIGINIPTDNRPDYPLDVRQDVNSTTAYFEKGIIVGGNITGNQIYGELWYHNDTGSSIPFSASGVYYNITAPTINYTLNGLYHVNGNFLKVALDGRYKVDYDMSGSGTANHNYHGVVLIDGSPQYNTESHFRVGTGTDVITISGSGFVDITTDNLVSLGIEDSTGTGTGTLYGFNLNLIRVGDIIT